MLIHLEIKKNIHLLV